MSSYVLEHIGFVYEHSLAEILFAQDQENKKHTPSFNTGFFYARGDSGFVKRLFFKIIEEQRLDPDNGKEQFILIDILKSSNFNDSRAQQLDPFLYAS